MGKSLPPSPAGDTLAAVERYREDVRQLAGRWMDAELYRAVVQDIERVRLGAHQLPMLSAAWIALLIAHAELMHALWHAADRPAAEGEPERRRLLAAVEEAARVLEAGCLRLAPPAAGIGAP